jgi:hypothetical protein
MAHSRTFRSGRVGALRRLKSTAGSAVHLVVSIDTTEVTRLVHDIVPYLIVLILVSGVALRLAVKPTIDAFLKLREGLRPDQDQTQQRIARLEDEVSRLRAGDLQVPPALDEGAPSKDPVRRS